MLLKETKKLESSYRLVLVSDLPQSGSHEAHKMSRALARWNSHEEFAF